MRAGQSLVVEVRDIDRAGRLDPWGYAGQGPRILDEVAWPRMSLRYELRESGRLMASADEMLRDQHYLMRAVAGGAGDDLRYEKQMIADWFAARFGER